MPDRSLPAHLELLLADGEPVLDLYSYGPWRVPDGLYEQVWERAEALNRDPRAERLHYERPDFFTERTTAVGVELLALIEYLAGIGSVRSGTHAELEWELLSGFAVEPDKPARMPMVWRTGASNFRPPGSMLVLAAGDDPELRELAYPLLRDCLDVFAGIDVFALPERPAVHPLLELDNVILTPHCGGRSSQNSAGDQSRRDQAGGTRHNPDRCRGGNQSQCRAGTADRVAGAGGGFRNAGRR